jgi:hypothetical protein
LLLVPPVIADTAVVFVTPTAPAAAATTVIVVIIVVAIMIVVVAIVNIVVIVIVVIVVVAVVVIAIAVAAVVFAAAAAAVVAVIAAAIAVAIATTTPTPPAFDAPVDGWLLRCCPLSAFVITPRHATVNALLASRLRRNCRCRCRRAATASIATIVVKLTVIHCQRKTTAAAPPAYQRQHQRKSVYKSKRLGLIKLIYSI